MNGFIHQKGKEIYDGQNNPILLKGIGFGNWLLPEGYMWKFYDDCDRPRRIEKLISDLIGKNNAREFWKQYYGSYISRDDIAYIKSRGLNSVRLPINARHLMTRQNGVRVLLQDGIQYIDNLIAWCEEFEIYIILDMHGALGGQTGTNIDDSEDDKPSLFIDEKYRNDLIWLWTELAKRYKDKGIIAGYDLLNEPLPEWFNKYNDKVMPLYYDLAEAIRQVDEKHMIILEGVHWATDWSIFESLKDDPIKNCILQFHKYWDNPDTKSIQRFLDKRDELNYPIFMGEGGENNLQLYAGVFHLLEQHNISWNFWSYKKMDTHNSPISIKSPKGWERIIRYIKGEKKPKDAKVIFDELLKNICFDNCIINEEVLNHVQRTAPIKLRAVFYDMINKNLGHDSKVPFRVYDGADIRFVTEDGQLSFKHDAGQDIENRQRICLTIHEGEKFIYSFRANGEDIIIKCKSKNDGIITVNVNGKVLKEVHAHKNMKKYKVGISLKSENLLSIEGQKGQVKVEWIKIG